MRARVLALVPFAVVAFAAACSSSTEVRTDGGTDSGAVDATSDATTDGGCVTTGAATWTALYTDYFGPTGKGQCGKAVGCHLDGTGGGTAWICGTTKDSCWQGIQKVVKPCAADQGLVPDILRKSSDPNAIGKMPADPVTVTYDPADVAKITSWINAGAKND